MSNSIRTLHPPTIAIKEFSSLPHRLGRFFESPTGNPVGYYPPTSIVETSDTLVVSAELAGLGPDDVKVSLENGVLVIEGEKAPASELGRNDEAKNGDNDRIRLNERRFGRFRRSFRLPRSVAGSEVTASFNQGVLKVVLPKSSDAKSRRIEVTAAC